MPIDPYFTSKVPDEDREKREQRTAYAKRNCAYLHFKMLYSKKQVKKSFQNALEDGKSYYARINKGQYHGHKQASPIDSGTKNVTGFKQPRKKWESAEDREKRLAAEPFKKKKKWKPYA